MSDLAGHLDPALVLAGNLALTQEGQGFAQGHLSPGRLVEQVVELVADGCQLQARQHLEQGVVVDHRQPPPAACSYSSSGLSNFGASVAIGGGPAAVNGISAGRADA